MPNGRANETTIRLLRRKAAALRLDRGQIVISQGLAEPWPRLLDLSKRLHKQRARVIMTGGGAMTEDDSSETGGEGARIESARKGLRVVPAPPVLLTPSPPVRPIVAFDRRELGVILNLYGRKVAAGEWRDYAIDFGTQTAIFSIYRRASEVPLYRIEKDPRLARKQGAYAVIAAGGLVMKRGADLARVISVLDKSVRLVSG